MLKVQERRVVPFVVVLSFALFVFIAMVSFGANTSCTNAWSCSSSNCAPCRVVSLATVGGLTSGALLGAGALLLPWRRRGRVVVYVAAIVATALLTLAVARTWGVPQRS